MQNYTPYFIENDCFRQVSAPDQNNYCLYEWKQPPRYYFYSFYFKHDFDITYISKTTAVKFLVNYEEIILKRGANIIIPAKNPYSFRGLENSISEMLVMGDARARESWESVARAMLTAQNLQRVS
jgi:hypothetical protein